MLHTKTKHLLAIFVLLIAFGCKHKKGAIKTVNEPKAIDGAIIMKEKLGLSTKVIQNNPLYKFVSDWYGTPYKYGGCDKTGVDCSCFTINLYENVYNRKVPRTAGEIYKACDKVELENAKEGDLLFFKINSNSITHVGVYLREKKFAHASTSKGVLVNSLTETYYAKYFYTAGKLKNK